MRALPDDDTTERSNKQQKHDTATEHDMPNTARLCHTADTTTEVAERDAVAATQAQRSDNSLENLCFNLGHFLTETLREELLFSTHTALTVSDANIGDVVRKQITNWSKFNPGEALDNAELRIAAQEHV